MVALIFGSFNVKSRKRVTVERVYIKGIATPFFRIKQRPRKPKVSVQLAQNVSGSF